MAGKGDAGFVDHALVHRCGDHPGEVPVEAALAGAGQGFQDVGGVGSVNCPGRTGAARGVSHMYSWPALAGRSGQAAGETS